MNVTKIILTRCQIFHLKCTRPPSWIWGREEKSEERKEGKRKRETDEGEEGEKEREGWKGGKDVSWSLGRSTPLDTTV